MHIERKVLLLVSGFIETVIFSGVILGWVSLLYILKEEGVYNHVCSNSISQNNDKGNSNLSIEETLPTEELNITFTNDKKITCRKQEDILNLAYTVGTCSMGCTVFIWGFILDHWGLRITRLLLNVQLLIGTILLMLTSTNTPYLLFPGIILICMSALPVRMTNFDVANLFPKYRTTIITVLTGTLNASAFVFALLKVFYEMGLPWKMCSLNLVVLSGSMFLVTFLLLPKNRITEEECMTIKNNNFQSASKNHNESSISIVSRNSEAINGDYGPVQDTVPNRQSEPPLRSTLLSVSCLLHCWWYSWMVTETIVYVGLLSVWLKRITSDESAAGNYTKVYGFTQIIGLALAPLPGIFMDWLSNRASKDPDTLKAKEKTRNVGFWPLMITTIALAVTLVCQFFNTTSALFFSMVFNSIMRSFQGPVANAHLRTKFPKEHFNRLQGIMGTAAAGFATVCQYVFYMWSSKSQEAFEQVNILCCILTLIAFLNPLYLLIPCTLEKQKYSNHVDM